MIGTKIEFDGQRLLGSLRIKNSQPYRKVGLIL